MKCQTGNCVRDADRAVDYTVTLGDPEHPAAQDRMKRIWLCDQHAHQFINDGGF